MSVSGQCEAERHEQASDLVKVAGTPVVPTLTTIYEGVPLAPTLPLAS